MGGRALANKSARKDTCASGKEVRRWRASQQQRDPPGTLGSFPASGHADAGSGMSVFIAELETGMQALVIPSPSLSKEAQLACTFRNG